MVLTASCLENGEFGLRWTMSEYIFCINGKEVSRTSCGNGVFEVDEEVIVSLEIPGKMNFERDYRAELMVDYVRVYQKD